MGRLLSLAVLVASVLLKPSSLFTQPLLLFEFGLVLDFLGYIFLSILFGWIILTEFGKSVMGGNGKGKSGAGSAKGANKGGAAPPAGVGQLAVTDEAWAAMSGKQRKLVLRTQNMVLHINGPKYQAPGQQPPRNYKDAAGSVGNTGSWYESRGPWVACQNASCPGCKRKGVVVPSFKYVADVQEGVAVNSQRCFACNKPWQD